MTFKVICILIGSLIQSYRLLPKRVLEIINDKYPLAEWGLAFLSILLIIYGSISIINEMLYEKRVKVFVHPQERTISPGWNEKFNFKVINNQDVPLYEITVHFVVETGDLKSESIEIKSEQEPKIIQEVKSGKGSYRLILDQFQLHAIDNTSGKKVLIYKINNIDAHKTKNYQVSINSNKIKEKSKISISLVSFSEEPPKTLSK